MGPTPIEHKPPATSKTDAPIHPPSAPLVQSPSPPPTSVSSPSSRDSSPKQELVEETDISEPMITQVEL